MRSLFSGPTGLRAGWRFLLYVSLFLAATALLQLLVFQVGGYKPHQGWHWLDFLLSDGTGLLAALAAAGVMARVDRRPLGDFGLPIRAGLGARFGEGALWGTTGVAALMALIWLAGGVSMDGLALHGSALARSAALWAMTMIILGLYEEFVFRGYPLVALAGGIGFWSAAITLSVFFGLLHYFTKPLETVMDALNVTLLALFLCLTFRRTGSLWFAAGFHAAFDFAAIIFFGAPNTGNAGKPVADHILATTFHGPVWLTGGPMGIEASVLAIVVIAAMGLLFDRRHPDRSPRAAVSPVATHELTS
ncbi:MAG: CPBP family intramembrane metalloprotease [Gemmatimonadota bacterium]|nr:CPBP family intramembrane metalloprotease [Gemmatimonadota bacterium]